MKDRHLIYGVHITDRLRHATTVQEVLTRGGKYIKTRLGLHEIEGNQSSPNGLLILEMTGPEEDCDKIADDLNAVEGVEVKKIVFDHPAG